MVLVEGVYVLFNARNIWFLPSPIKPEIQILCFFHLLEFGISTDSYFLAYA